MRYSDQTRGMESNQDPSTTTSQALLDPNRQTKQIHSVSHSIEAELLSCPVPSPGYSIIRIG